MYVHGMVINDVQVIQDVEMLARVNLGILIILKNLQFSRTLMALFKTIVNKKCRFEINFSQIVTLDVYETRINYK